MANSIADVQQMEAAKDVNRLGLLLKDSDYQVAFEAARALARLKSDQALECLISALKIDDSAAAILGLGKTGDPRAGKTWDWLAPPNR